MIFDKPDFELIICDNYHQLAEQVVKRILDLSRTTIKNRGVFSIALSGGSTPKGLYFRMASPDYRNQFKWNQIHFFWGDERWVPIDDIRSNYRMAAEALLTKCDIPPENIHPIKTKEVTPEVSAGLYEQDLVSHFKLRKSELPRFDLILLGVGQDGHIASLFPGNKALTEKKKFVVSTSVEDVEEPRVTLALPVINQAHHVIFMVSGVEKAAIVGQVLGKSGRKDILVPAQLVDPERGTRSWFIDKAAMSVLENRIAST